MPDFTYRVCVDQDSDAPPMSEATARMTGQILSGILGTVARIQGPAGWVLLRGWIVRPHRTGAVVTVTAQAKDAEYGATGLRLAFPVLLKDSAIFADWSLTDLTSTDQTTSDNR